jgi:UDP-glucose 4-epimerase
MKLASEAQATAAAEQHLDRLALCRFPNVVGAPATHGVILDLVRKLKADPKRLDVLGDGSQRKAYLHVDDLIAAMLVVRDRSNARVAAFNIGPLDAGVTVGWIAQQVVARVAPGARIMLGQGDRGWVGDVPQFSYRTERIQALGWAPAQGSEAAVLRAIDEIALQEGV